MCISPTVLPALQLGHVQSKSSAQRLEDGKKLPTVTMQSRREGKAGASKRVGISKKVVSGVNRGRTNNQSKTLFQWLKKGNSLKDSSTYGTRTSEVGEGRGSRDCMMGGSGRGGGIDSGHDGSDICSNYHGGCSGVGAGGETGSGNTHTKTFNAVSLFHTLAHTVTHTRARVRTNKDSAQDDGFHLFQMQFRKCNSENTRERDKKLSLSFSLSLSLSLSLSF